MKKPYFVTLTFDVIVMAESADEAEFLADSHASSLSEDVGGHSSHSQEVTSLERLAQIAPEWGPECAPFFGDGSTLGEILPENEPEKDTLTIDLFEGVSNV